MGILNGRTAIISGAGTGLGKAAAISFAQEGAHVVLLGRRQIKLDETAAIIEHEGNGKALALQTDIADPQQVNQAIDRVLMHSVTWIYWSIMLLPLSLDR